MDMILSGKPADMKLIAELAKKLDVEIEFPPKKQTWEEATKDSVSLDEFITEAKSGLKKAYADARRAGLIAG